MEAARKAIRALREIIYPEGAICLGCGKAAPGQCLCAGCRKELMEYGIMDAWETREVDGVRFWSARPHRGVARTLVLRLKHGAERRAAAELAAVLRTRPAAFPVYPPDTIVTWVPGPKGRILERCVDHGKILAEAFAAELGLRCEQLLRREGNDRPQATLSVTERQKNLRKAFQPLRKITEPVLLTDDVLTTGTTAQRCVQALRAGGAEEIYGLTATRASRI